MNTVFDEARCSQIVQCLQFDVREYNEETDYKVGIIVVGSLLAFLLGLLICFIIARTCLRGLLLKKAREFSNRKKSEANEKRRIQIERKKKAQLITKNDSDDNSSIISSTTTDDESSDDQEKIEFDPEMPDNSEEYIQQERTNQLEKKLRHEIDEEFSKGTVPSDLRVYLPHDFKQTSSCFAQAITVNDIAQAEKELMVQDSMNLALLLHEARLEKFQAAVQLLRVLLTPLKKQEKISAEVGVTILKQFDKGLEEEWSKRKKELFLRVKHIQIEEKKPDKLKQAVDSLTQEEILTRKRNAIKDAQAEFISEANKVLDTVTSTMQLTLQNHSDLTNEDVEEMISKFKKNMSHLEQLICDNILLQHTLQQRTYVKRRKTAFVMVAQKTSVNKCNLNKLNSMKMIMRSKINAKDFDSIQGKYERAALEKIESNLLDESVKFQKVAQELSESRNDKLAELENQLTAQERSEFFGKEAPQLKKAAEFLQAYHMFQVRQREERSKLNEVLDHEEAQRMEKLLPKHSSDITEVEEAFVKKLSEDNVIAQNDVNYILKSFENQQKKLIEKEQKTLEEFRAALVKEHTQVKQNVSEDRNTLLSELKMVQEMLESTLSKLLNSQVNLDEKSKEIIQSEFKMLTLKLKTTLLSQKLIQRNVCKQNCAERRARLAEYKQKQQMEFLLSPSKGRESKMRTQDEMLEAEEKRIKLLNSKEELNSRGYSAQQTESAIKQHESEMSSVIGRITAECARRQLILNRQSRAIDELQKTLLGQLSESSTSDISSEDVQKIMNELKMNLEHLKMTHTSDREQQRVLLETKIQAKKLLKEQQVKQQVLSDTKRVVKENAIADSEMKKLIFYQKEQDSLNQIEREMSEEEKMQWKVLERKLNKELEEKLEENRKEFIVKMAIMGNLGEEKVIQLVYNSIVESGIDSHKAKALMKDIKKRLEQTRNDVERGRKSGRRKSSDRSSGSNDNEN